MPLGCDPSMTVAVVLSSDLRLPDDKRPRFLCRFLTPRRHNKINELLKRVQGSPTDEQWKIVREAVALCVTGWERMTDEDGNAVPFSMDAMMDLLNPYEIYELLGLARTETEAKARDFFVSGSPSPSGTSSPAPDAESPAASGPIAATGQSQTTPSN